MTSMPSVSVPLLQVLHIDHNAISQIPEQAFLGFPSLQILDLNHNFITFAHSEALSGLHSLRILDLSHNRLTFLPEELFARTQIERLNLTHNALRLSVFPSFYSIRTSLRYLDLSLNQIQALPSLEIGRLYELLCLNLSGNGISFVHNDAFTNLTHLLTLDLSHNPLWHLDETPLRSIGQLLSLHLENSSISHVPPLPFHQLDTLNLAENQIYNISDSAFARLQRLRHLDISRNLLQDVPRHLWFHLPRLTQLDLSHNPIENLSSTSFSGLDLLRDLDLRRLALKHLDTRSLYGLRFLTVFKTGTYPELRGFRLHTLLSKAVSLRQVTVEVEEPVLAHQLQWTFGSKLRELVVTGRRLRHVLPDAFLGLHHIHELTLRITGTSVDRLPAGLLRYLADVRFLTLDLRDNNLTTVERGTLQHVDHAHAPGTQHIIGAVMLDGNPWVCSCELLWLSRWLQRWMRETLRVQVLHFDAALYAHALASKAECLLPDTGKKLPIIELTREDGLRCYAQNRATSLCSLIKTCNFLYIIIWILCRTLPVK